MASDVAVSWRDVRDRSDRRGTRNLVGFVPKRDEFLEIFGVGRIHELGESGKPGKRVRDDAENLHARA